MGPFFGKLRSILLLAFVSAPLVIATSSAFACGTVRHWTARYDDPAATDASRASALFELSRNCDGYLAVESDRALLPVLVDALGRSMPRADVQAVFDNFRCLPGAEGARGYADLTGSMDMSACPTDDDLARWSVVTVDYANIRSQPAVSGARAGVVARGSVVVSEGSSGDWLAVSTWAGDKGYIRQDLVTPYPQYRADFR